VFCNFKASIQRVSDYLTEKGIPHGCFYGGLEQNEREQALIKFRNGTNRIILATDLAARGIDVPEIDYIVHYHLPLRPEEFTHRNGRTARMNSKGTAFVLQWEQEDLPDFIGDLEVEQLSDAPIPNVPEWKTVFVSGGRKDKISKGDIAGTFFRKGELKKGELGVIELKNDCAFVAVAAHQTNRIIDILDNSRLKKRKIRVKEI
ncbi:MAG: helicase-related protein, partial [Saprospiraceae bacterium]